MTPRSLMEIAFDPNTPGIAAADRERERELAIAKTRADAVQEIYNNPDIMKDGVPDTASLIQALLTHELPGLQTMGSKMMNSQLMNQHPSQYITGSMASDMVDKDGNPVQVDVGMTMGDAKRLGWRYAPKLTSAEYTQEVNTKQSKLLVQQLKRLVGEGADITGLPGVVEDMRSKPNLWSQFLNSTLNTLGVEYTEENAQAMSLSVSLSNRVIAAIRGAQVGPQEQERFERELPVPGQPRELFMANIEKTEANLAYLEKLWAQRRGLKPGDEGFGRTWMPGDGPKPGWFWGDDRSE